jgi:hypothetical protein
MPGGGAPRVLPLTATTSLIVASVPADTYKSGVIESRLTDLDWVARCGTAHHAVSDELATKHTVVPFRLFTLFSSEARVLSTLGRRQARIDEALEHVKGKSEWVLRVAKPGATGATGATRATGATGAAGASGTSFLQRKAAARQAAAEAATRVREGVTTTFDTLADIAAESKARPIDPALGLLLDAAFLVSSRQLPAFKRALTAAAAPLLEEGCRVSLTGPWPPYSFVSLDETSRHV